MIGSSGLVLAQVTSNWFENVSYRSAVTGTGRRATVDGMYLV